MVNLFKNAEFYVTNAKNDNRQYRCTSPGVQVPNKISTVVDSMRFIREGTVQVPNKISTVVDLAKLIRQQCLGTE